MVRSMTLSHAVPHFHYSDEVRLGALMALRSRLKADAALHGVKLTYLPFIIKAISVALREYPIINSSISEDGSTVWPCSPSKKGGGGSPCLGFSCGWQLRCCPRGALRSTIVALESIVGHHSLSAVLLLVP
jgi:2-oxoacid dehydrogenases acyltransferase (catalytic domain)